MTSRRTPPANLRFLCNCRDLTRWLEGAGPAPVHIALMELEAAPVEAIVAAATFVGIRRQILAELRTLGHDPVLIDLRASLTVNAHEEKGLEEDCLELITREAAGRPIDALAERLHRTHGLHPVLAMASYAAALGRLLIEPPHGFPMYNELYIAEWAWLTGCPRHSSRPGQVTFTQPLARPRTRPPHAGAPNAGSTTRSSTSRATRVAKLVSALRPGRRRAERCSFAKLTYGARSRLAVVRMRSRCSPAHQVHEPGRWPR